MYAKCDRILLYTVPFSLITLLLFIHALLDGVELPLQPINLGFQVGGPYLTPDDNFFIS
jgi:hypothetical protein